MSIAVTVLYDSLCPVCRREVDFLRFAGRKDELRLVDIASPDFKAEEFGLTLDECIGSIRGFDSAGRPLVGMDTIRAMYDAVGLGWLMRWTKLPGASALCDRAYLIFAHFRPRFSAFRPDECTADRCRTD